MSYIFINLEYILNKRGISKREFANRTGIRHPTILEMCNNKAKHLPLDNIAVICDELEIDVSDLLILRNK